MVGWLDGWLDGWMVGWLDGWMVGWSDGWMVGEVDSAGRGHGGGYVRVTQGSCRGRKMIEHRRIFDEILRESIHNWPDPVKIHRKPQLSMDFDVKIDDFL